MYNKIFKIWKWVCVHCRNHSQLHWSPTASLPMDPCCPCCLVPFELCFRWFWAVNMWRFSQYWHRNTTCEEVVAPVFCVCASWQVHRQINNFRLNPNKPRLESQVSHEIMEQLWACHYNWTIPLGIWQVKTSMQFEQGNMLLNFPQGLLGASFSTHLLC